MTAILSQCAICSENIDIESFCCVKKRDDNDMYHFKCIHELGKKYMNDGSLLRENTRPIDDILRMHFPNKTFSSEIEPYHLGIGNFSYPVQNDRIQFALFGHEYLKE